MMTAMHSPLTLPTEVARSAPDGVEALGWGVSKASRRPGPGWSWTSPGANGGVSRPSPATLS